jgi:lipoprotein-anchoring transpeptidase ErfK/SrfK
LKEAGMLHVRFGFALAIALAAAATMSTLRAEPLSLAPVDYGVRTPFDRVLRDVPDGADAAIGEAPSQLAPELRRQLVAYPLVGYPSGEAPGAIIIDTANARLYYVLGGGRAIRYGIGVGRHGFTWSGVETISRMAEWPDWSPPPEMIARQPYLPRFMAGGPGNPLGARALYLGNTAYRVHGTNDPSSIGHHVSSGCIRLTNEDIIDLYGRVKPGTKVIVLPASSRPAAPAQAQARVQAHALLAATSGASR